MLAYNFPPHGGTELAPETLGRIAAACPNLAGVKDSSGNLQLGIDYRLSPRFAVAMSG